MAKRSHFRTDPGTGAQPQIGAACGADLNYAGYPNTVSDEALVTCKRCLRMLGVPLLAATHGGEG